MTVSVEVFYSFQSPYSYLALESIYALGTNYDIELLWQPFSAKASGEQITPAPVIAEKLAYLIEDTKRTAEENHIPLVFPEGWPKEEFDPSRITRGALIAGDLGILMEYNIKVFQRCWGEGANPNDEEFMAALCEDLDVDLGEFLSKISSSDTRERVKGVYRRGKKFGVFDTPTLIIDKDRFVGMDKVHYVAQRLERMGLKRGTQK